MHPNYLLPIVTLTILTRLNAINSSPLDLQTSSGFLVNQNFAAPVPTTASPYRLQNDARNQNLPSRSIARQDNPVRSPITTFANSGPSQVSNILPVSNQVPENAGPQLPATWAGAKPSEFGRNVHSNQPILDHPDRLVEGSGAGPPVFKESHKSKLDDTDDSEDEGDDEDYDSSEGTLDNVSHLSKTTQKPNISSPQGDTTKKPDYNDFYKPFRPAVTGPANPNIGSNQNYVINTHTTNRPTTSPTTLVPATSLPVPIHQPAIARRPVSNATSLAGPAVSVPPAVAKNKTESDYDYEDDNGEDDMEEASVFEDNDNDDPSSPTHANSSQQTPHLVNNQINATRLEPARMPASAGNTQLGSVHEQSPPKVSHSNVELVRPAAANQSGISSPPVMKYNLTTTSRPMLEPVKPGNEFSKEDEDLDDEEEEEDDVEEEEEEEEIPEAMDDNTEDDATTDNQGAINARPVNNSSMLMNNHQVSGQKPATNSMMTNSGPQTNAHAPAVLHAITHSSLGDRKPEVSSTLASITQPTTASHTTVSPISHKLPPWSVPTTPTYMPTVAPIMHATTPQPTMHPVASFTTQKAPIFVTSPPVILQREQPPSPPPKIASPPADVPVYFPTTPRPYLTSPVYQTKRVTPPVTTYVEPYDQRNFNLSNNDDSLTRQIYDKAKEAYLEADKTVRAAVDAVWPPNFNFDSNSIEPLLAQPILFMLALGGAIICLVLLMMLVVYMISYQTKPRRYEPDDISIY